MPNPYVPQNDDAFNENVAETLAESALRRCASGGGEPASRLLLVAAVYRHLQDADTQTLLKVVRQTLQNAGAVR